MRSVRLLVGVATCAVLLTGCGSDGGSSSAGPSTGPEPTASSAPSTSAAGAPASVALTGPAPTTPLESISALLTQLGPELAPAPPGTALTQVAFAQCAATYPGAKGRAASLLDLRGGSSLPTPALAVETVAYTSPATAAQALKEIRGAVGSCTTRQYADLPPADQQDLTADHAALSWTQGGASLHLLAVRRGSVVVVVTGTDTTVADSTARTMTLYLAALSPAAAGE